MKKFAQFPFCDMKSDILKKKVFFCLNKMICAIMNGKKIFGSLSLSLFDLYNSNLMYVTTFT